MQLFAHTNPHIQSIAEFIESERNRYTCENGNRFIFALNCISKKYRAIWTLKRLSAPLAAEFVTLARSSFDRASNLTPTDHLQRIAKTNELSEELILLFECFFMNAAILCDELAHLLLYFFGEARGIKMSGHRVLCNSFTSYATAKGIDFDPELLGEAKFLELEVCEFRDKQIVHDFNPRKLDFIGFDNVTEDIFLNCGAFFYPKESDLIVVSKPWNELIARLDNYVRLHLKLIHDNHAHSRLNRA